MKILQETKALATPKLLAGYEHLKDTVFRAVRQDRPLHEVEQAVWEQLLRLGREALPQGFALLGNGDRGETVELPAGRCCRRLPQEHQRRYVSICGAFGPAGTTVQRLLGLKQSGDSLEYMNQEMARAVTTFLRNRPQPEREGEVVVASADQKGIVMRRAAGDPPPKAHRTPGDKASQKRRATVATVSTAARWQGPAAAW